MTNYDEVLRAYVDSVNAVSQLFGANHDRKNTYGEFAIAMKSEVTATAAYISSLKEQGQEVPSGLEGRNNLQAKIYFPLGLGAAI